MKMFRNGNTQPRGLRRLRRLEKTARLLEDGGRPFERLLNYLHDPRRFQMFIGAIGAIGAFTLAGAGYFLVAKDDMAAARMVGMAGIAMMSVPVLAQMVGFLGAMSLEGVQKAVEKKRAKTGSLIDARDIARIRRQRQQRRRP